MSPARLFFEAPALGNLLPLRIILEDGHIDIGPAIFCYRIIIFFRIREHFIFQIFRAEVRMDVQAEFTAADVIQHSNDSAIRGFPKRHPLFHRFKDIAGFDVMPAPVIEPRDMPTVFEPVIERKDFAQKIAGAPEVVFSLNFADRYFHVVPIAGPFSEIFSN